MKEAIQKAIGGGYPEGKYTFSVSGGHVKTDTNAIFLDPLFWQALGKAMGWKEWERESEDMRHQWRINWHRFIDHLAEGKDAESFFNELLT